jgi:hypothetical protein
MDKTTTAKKKLKVKTGAEKMRVSFKGYKGELGKATQDQLREFFDLSNGKSKFVVEE